MAFGEKYRLEYKDYFDNSWKVSLYNEGWAGAVTSVIGGINPFEIHYLSNGNDLSQTIIGSEATISIISETNEQFSDIWTSKVKDWLVVASKGGSEMWRGYIDTEEYSEPLLYPPYESVFKCFDGIGVLKTTDLTDTLTFVPHILLKNWIGVILEDTDFQLDYWIAVDILNDKITTRLFDQTYIDYRAFQKKGAEFLDNYTILEYILSALQARIYQDSGKWIIERIYYKSSDSIVFEKYNYQAVHQSQETINKRISLTSSTGSPLCVWEGQTQQLEIIPAWKNYTLKLDNEQRKNILNTTNWDGEFNDGEFLAGFLKYWDKVGTISYSHITGGKTLRISGGQAGVPIANYLKSTEVNVVGDTDNPVLIGLDGASSGYLAFKVYLTLSPDFPYGNPNSGDFYFGLECKFNNSCVSNGQPTWIYPPPLNSIGVTSDTDPTIPCQLGGTNATIYYYTDNGEYWHNTASYSLGGAGRGTAGMSVATSPGTREYSFETKPIYVNQRYLGSMQPTVRLRGHKWDSDTLSTGVEIRNVRLEVIEYVPIGTDIEDIGHTRTITENINEKYTKEPPEINLKFDDRTVRGINKEYNRFNLLYYDGSNYRRSESWFITGNASTGLGLIDNVHRLSIRSQYNKPRRKLSGDLIVDDMTFSSVVEDSDSRRYLPVNFKWNTKTGVRSSEWHELQLQGSITQSGAFDDEAFATAFDI